MDTTVRRRIAATKQVKCDKRLTMGPPISTSHPIDDDMFVFSSDRISTAVGISFLTISEPDLAELERAIPALIGNPKTTEEARRAARLREILSNVRWRYLPTPSKAAI